MTRTQRAKCDFASQLQRYSETAAANRAVNRAQSFGPVQRVSWLAYTSAAAAATVMSTTAEATIIYSGLQNASLILDSTIITSSSYRQFFGELLIDLDADGVDDLSLQGDFDSFSYFGVKLVGLNGAEIARQRGNLAAAFQSGQTIGASQTFGAAAYLLVGSFGDSTGEWNRYGSDTFAGVRVDGNYGWIRIEITPRWTNDQATVVDWAYDTLAGEPIVAGAIPEPGAEVLTGLGLLALGARGLRRQRERSQRVRGSQRLLPPA